MGSCIINKFDIPNKDEIRGCTIIPKEVLQKAYLDSVGNKIHIFGHERIVTGVEITEEYIKVTLN